MDDTNALLKAILSEIKIMNEKLDDIYGKTDWAQHHASAIDTNTTGLVAKLDDVISAIEELNE